MEPNKESLEITISLVEYRRLQEIELELTALQNAGVDNWVGYDYAMTILEEMKAGLSEEPNRS